MGYDFPMLMTLALIVAAWTVLSVPLTLLVGRVIATGQHDGPAPAEPRMASSRVIHVRW